MSTLIAEPHAPSEHGFTIELPKRAKHDSTIPKYAIPGPDTVPNAILVLPDLHTDEQTDQIVPVSDATESTKNIGLGDSRLIQLSQGRTKGRRFEMLQQWEGVIDEFDDDTVWATLQDLYDNDKPAEVVQIPLSEFSRADIPILYPGSVFYWSIGYEERKDGQRVRLSEFRVRRTPKWSKRKIERMRKRGKELHRQFGTLGEDATAGEQ